MIKQKNEFKNIKIPFEYNTLYKKYYCDDFIDADGKYKLGNEIVGIIKDAFNAANFNGEKTSLFIVFERRD